MTALTPYKVGMTTPLAGRTFSRAESYRMGRAGILSPDRHGELIERSPIVSRPAACVDCLNAVFPRIFAKRAIVRVENPLGPPLER